MSKIDPKVETKIQQLINKMYLSNKNLKLSINHQLLGEIQRINHKLNL